MPAPLGARAHPQHSLPHTVTSTHHHLTTHPTRIMIPAQHSLKQMRESQRQRSLGLSTQQRLSHLSGRAHPKSSSSPSALNPHSPAFKSRVRPHGAGGSHVKWGGSKHELADERRIAVGEALSDEDTAHIPATTSHAASPHAAARDTAREVALVDLVAPDSRNRRECMYPISLRAWRLIAGVRA